MFCWLFPRQKKAFSSWGKSTKEFRCRWLMKLANAIDDRLKDLAEAESFDNGKPVWLAESWIFLGVPLIFGFLPVLYYILTQKRMKWMVVR